MATVECVPNFSEGRRPEVVAAIELAAREVPGVRVLGMERDADHNRCVLTFAGEPAAVVEAAVACARKAAELIDLRNHQGEHPRMGATDVIPFVPIEGVDMAACVELARRCARRIGDELGIPAFLYGEAATRDERRNLAQVREGEFEGLRELIGKDPAKTPDFGPHQIHASAGATAVGARFFLIAYNVNLESRDLKLAKRIAKAIREKDGGMKGVRALGLELRDSGCVQVSMNLVDYRQTSPAHAFARIAELAAAEGVQ
nr:glutamate formimidoyltransferase [Planctomycetota bacterium]